MPQSSCSQPSFAHERQVPAVSSLPAGQGTVQVVQPRRYYGYSASDLINAARCDTNSGFTSLSTIMWLYSTDLSALRAANSAFYVTSARTTLRNQKCGWTVTTCPLSSLHLFVALRWWNRKFIRACAKAVLLTWRRYKRRGVIRVAVKCCFIPTNHKYSWSFQLISREEETLENWYVYCDLYAAGHYIFYSSRKSLYWGCTEHKCLKNGVFCILIGPVTREARGWAKHLLEKCVGRGLKLLDIVQKICAPLWKLLAPPGVPSWLRAWFSYITS